MSPSDTTVGSRLCGSACKAGSCRPACSPQLVHERSAHGGNYIPNLTCLSLLCAALKVDFEGRGEVGGAQPSRYTDIELSLLRNSIYTGTHLRPPRATGTPTYHIYHTYPTASKIPHSTSPPLSADISYTQRRISGFLFSFTRGRAPYGQNLVPSFSVAGKVIYAINF